MIIFDISPVAISINDKKTYKGSKPLRWNKVKYLNPMCVNQLPVFQLRKAELQLKPPYF